MLSIKSYKNMSIEAAISKKWIVTSHHLFYNFIKDRDSILEKSIELRIFRDHLFLSKHGCPCNSEENENVSLQIYQQLDKLDSSIFEEIKNDIGCTSIIFKLNEKNLFEL